MDKVDVWAGAWNDEVLVESRECELTDGASEEGRCRGVEVLQATIIAVLLAFLADDAADEGDKLEVTIGGKGVQCVLESAEDDVRELGSKSDSVVEVVGGEDVLARLDGCLSSAGQDAIRAQEVELLLSKHCSDVVDHELPERAALDTEAFYVVCDVVEERREEGSLNQRSAHNHCIDSEIYDYSPRRLR